MMETMIKIHAPIDGCVDYMYGLNEAIACTQYVVDRECNGHIDILSEEKAAIPLDYARKVQRGYKKQNYALDLYETFLTKSHFILPCSDFIIEVNAIGFQWSKVYGSYMSGEISVYSRWHKGIQGDISYNCYYEQEKPFQVVAQTPGGAFPVFFDNILSMESLGIKEYDENNMYQRSRLLGMGGVYTLFQRIYAVCMKIAREEDEARRKAKESQTA